MNYTDTKSKGEASGVERLVGMAVVLVAMVVMGVMITKLTGSANSMQASCTEFQRMVQELTQATMC